MLLQYLFAANLSDLCGTLSVMGKNAHHFDWVTRCTSRPIVAPSVPLQDVQTRDVVGIMQQFLSVPFKCRGVPSQLELLPSWQRSNQLVSRPAKPTYLASDMELLINVRGNETLGDCHHDYGPIPIYFLRQVVEKAGLNPVFMGQIEDDYYSIALQREFPTAKFVRSNGPDQDFEAIRRAHHIVPAVSTFSWLASWLSSAKTIYFPILGMFNPLQRPDSWFLPLDEPRYKFYDFPIRYWRATRDQKESVLFGHYEIKEKSFSDLKRCREQNILNREKNKNNVLKEFRKSCISYRYLSVANIINVEI